MLRVQDIRNRAGVRSAAEQQAGKGQKVRGKGQNALQIRNAGLRLEILMPRNPTQREVLPIKCFHCSNTFSTVSGLCEHLRRAGVKPAAEQARVFQFQICEHCQLPYPSLGRHTKCKSSSQQSQPTDASPEPTPPPAKKPAATETAFIVGGAASACPAATG